MVKLKSVSYIVGPRHVQRRRRNPLTIDPRQAAPAGVCVPESPKQASNTNLPTHLPRYSRLRERVRSYMRRSRWLPAVRRLRGAHHEVFSEEDGALQ